VESRHLPQLPLGSLEAGVEEEEEDARAARFWHLPQVSHELFSTSPNRTINSPPKIKIRSFLANAFYDRLQLSLIPLAARP
jgi:hypothetical protein